MKMFEKLATEKLATGIETGIETYIGTGIASSH